MDNDYSIYTGQVRKFATMDYVLFALTLSVSAGIGIFYALRDRRRNTPEEFLLGGHKMHVVPVAMSLMVTFLSSLSMLGYPAEMYNYNTMFWWLAGCFVVAIGGSVAIFIPFFYNLGITSTFEKKSPAEKYPETMTSEELNALYPTCDQEASTVDAVQDGYTEKGTDCVTRV